jgi:hypothetical protein
MSPSRTCGLRTGLAVLLTAPMSLAACGAQATAPPAAPRLSAIPVTEPDCGTYSGQGCTDPADRIDLALPVFSDPTRITNPRFPIGELHSALLLGHVDGKPFRTETTLLPGTGTVVWNGRPVEVLVSQYVAFYGGRLQEVAIDRYAQADDGSVWYLGEDVFDYAEGTVDRTEGTWLAGREGPPAMIMPADPQVGDVYRPENIPGIVFEEVTVTSVEETVDGPLGPVPGAILVSELHADGSTEDKTFVPGYGEFVTSGGGDLEALAMAVPADAAGDPAPPELSTLSTGAQGVLEATRTGNWEAATAAMARMNSAWQSLQSTDQPRMVVERLAQDLENLAGHVQAERTEKAAQRAVDVGQSALDLTLRYSHPDTVDLLRFELWTQQLRIHAAAGDAAAVSTDVATLEWVRDRFTDAVDPAELTELDGRLRGLRSASDAGNLPAAADHAARLGMSLRTLQPSV